MPDTSPTRLDRNARMTGGLVGLLVGDALGVPYEFHPAEHIPPAVEIEFAPPPGFARSHRGVPPGTWSDDGAQALCLLASLLDAGRFDEKDFGTRLLRWYDDGYLAVDGVVFDIGIQTGIALDRIRAGVYERPSHPDHVYENGNGSLMRVLPLALWHRGTDAELVADAHRQSAVTHGHVRAHVCCALYCLVARRMLRGEDDPWVDAIDDLRRLYANAPEAVHELDTAIRPDDVATATGSGYVVDCLRSARQCLRETSYESAVRAAVSLGKDTDTTACVTGGLAGIRWGVDAIPARWRHALRGEDLCGPLLRRLLASMPAAD